MIICKTIFSCRKTDLILSQRTNFLLFPTEKSWQTTISNLMKIAKSSSTEQKTLGKVSSLLFGKGLLKCPYQRHLDTTPEKCSYTKEFVLAQIENLLPFQNGKF